MLNQKPEISIVVPGIRPERWETLYKSVQNSTKRSFELIFVGPYPLDNSLQGMKNVKYIKDFGSPIRASCIGVDFAEGTYLTWASDDGTFIQDALDDIMDYKADGSIKLARYYEGEPKVLQGDTYFTLNGAECTKSPHFPDHWWIFNVAVMPLDTYYAIGGWDCSFEACPMAHSDLAVRAQRIGYKASMTPYAMLDCDHMPDRSGDHGPIHDAQTQHDELLFQSRYADGVFPDFKILKWQESPRVWLRRFG